MFGRGHYLVDAFVEYYHTAGPHQGIGNATPNPGRNGPGSGPIRCESRLGGVLNHYSRAA